MTALLPPEAAGEPACRLDARPIAFDDIARSDWDRLLAATPAATPFSRWTVHRAWWDAYGSTAHEQYVVCESAGGGKSVAIAPLMHRHAVEPEDEATATVIRRRKSLPSHGVAATAKVIFMGASYHADYATLLVAPGDLPNVAPALVDHLCEEPNAAHGSEPWDVVDLRRLRESDPAVEALETAFRERAREGSWQVEREQEDVCPVVRFPEGTGGDATFEAFLGSLGKKERHEIRRKLRRAEAQGPLEFRLVEPTPDEIDRFIDLHQGRWRENGLFPPTAGGDRSRRFLHRLAELELAEGDGRRLQLGWLDVGGRTIFAALGFDDGETCYFYNAGMDPDARELSPGVVGAAAYIRDRLEAGRRRFDFLRGNESYKYEWGAVDEPIHRLLVTRTGRA